MKLIYIFLALFTMSCADKQPEEPLNHPEQREIISANYLALGDSYTIGESVDAELRWPVQLADILSKFDVNLEVEIIARTGWRTDDLLKAINDEGLNGKYNLVSLLIGVNNQYQGRPISQYVEEFEILLKKGIELAKENDPKRVLVLSIPDYGYTPFGENHQETISGELDEYNRINKEISESHGVHYVDITPISRGKDADLVAGDGLHPSGYQYSLWVQEIMKIRESILAVIKSGD